MTGDNINIASASNDSSTTMPAIAVLGEALTNNASGKGVVNGKIIGVDTDGFTAGRNIYVNANGDFTQTKPTGSALIQNIGVVGKVNVTDGEIVIQGSGRSNDLPNILEGYAWVGDSDGVPQAVLTSSFAGDSFPYTGIAEITGALDVSGSILRQQDGFSGSVIDNITDTFRDSVPEINHIVTLTQTEYDGLGSVDENTLYIISGSIVDSEFPYSGSAQITGSLGVTGSIEINDGTNSSNVVSNLGDTFASTPDATKIATLTQTEYDGIGTKDSNTLYVISGSFITGSTGDNGTSGVNGTNGTSGISSAGFPFTGSAGISGSLDVVGPITREEDGFSGSVIDNITDVYQDVADISHVVSLTSASYEALATKDPNTLYVVSGSTSAATLSPYTGSIRGNVENVVESGGDVALDFSTSNFFSSSIDDDTNFVISNIEPGQTVLLRVDITNATPSASFSTNVLQPEGSEYTPSANGSIDVLTFTSFDSTNALLVAVNKFI